MTQLPIGKYRKLETSLGSKNTTTAVCRPDNKQNRCKLRKNVNVRSFTLEEVRHSHGSKWALQLWGSGSILKKKFFKFSFSIFLFKFDSCIMLYFDIMSIFI